MASEEQLQKQHLEKHTLTQILGQLVKKNVKETHNLLENHMDYNLSMQ